MKRTFTWIVLIVATILLMQQFSFQGSEMFFFVPIAVLILVLMLMKRWFPSLFTIMKRITLRSVKALVAALWQKPERKGGANVRSQRLRWKQ
jgi:hypothetical protein